MSESMRLHLVCGIAMAAMCAAATGQNAPDATGVSAPPAEAFRVLPPADAPGPQISPYLLYQTQLAWHQDQLRLERWSLVKTESDLLRLRAELDNRFSMRLAAFPRKKLTCMQPLPAELQAMDTILKSSSIRACPATM